MTTWRHIAIVTATKAAIGALVLLGGFRAVSDDDFARVVHAQEWALDPKLDPSGTSWLPLPFWIYGVAMRLVAPSMDVARATAIALGIASACLIYAAARLLLEDARDALVGTLIACILPWSARLGVATVPELPTAALTLYGIATLARPDAGTRALGALALCCACLSRYEPWPVAALFAGYCVYERRWVASAIAVAGSIAWLVHNAVAHGDPLHFLERVSAYREAVGGASLVIGYPLALLREEPELAIVSLACAVAARDRLPATLRRTAIALGAMLLFLTLATLRGGAPTHHAGRALLAIWLAAAVYAGAAARAALRSPTFRRGYAAMVVILMPLGALWLRPWFSRLDSFIQRDAELAIGAAAARATSDHVLVEAVDYGFFAIQAGSAAPRMFILDREIDPRAQERPSSFTSADAIRARAQALGVRWVVGRSTAATSALDPPVAAVDGWALWSLR